MAVLLGLLVVGYGLYAKSEQIVLGAEAYIFGYPLVIMDVTRVNAAQTLGPENQLRRVRRVRLFVDYLCDALMERRAAFLGS